MRIANHLPRSVTNVVEFLKQRGLSNTTKTPSSKRASKRKAGDPAAPMMKQARLLLDFQYQPHAGGVRIATWRIR
ncbi:unnamed protein product [Ceutorhynchus assimilis]|uniref:Uncharacterized protein n=1 Tax=Ceutorhynchus assimilis TaxID=467358 RepID=A0A9N9MCG9_9CUCU|nr:unnamed protein product [Ceutorhynchus assimilis]